LGIASIQAFLTNLFNNKAYTSAADNWTIEQSYAYLSTHSAVLAGLPFGWPALCMWTL
jgi:iron complex outermembrane receptor protein